MTKKRNNRTRGRQAQLDKRREMVAALVLRGLTLREIVEALAKKAMVNPDTGVPYKLAAVHCDVVALRKQWKEAAVKDTEEYVARTLAELGEVKKSAWAKGRLDWVLDAHDREARLLKIPNRTDVTSDGRPLFDADSMRAELARRLDSLIDAD